MKKIFKFCFLLVMLTSLFISSTIYANNEIPIVIVNDINENVTKITPTPTPSPSPMPSPTPTLTPSPPPSPIPTSTPMPTPTPTPLPSPTPTPNPIPKTGDDYLSILLIGLLSVASLILIKKYKNLF